MTMETIDKNKVKLTFEVGPEKFEEGLKHSYNKNKSRFDIPGFRKGKVPRKIIEMNYGKEIFFEDAIDFVLGDAYSDAVTSNNLDVVSRPEIDVVSISTEDGIVFSAEVFTKPEVKISDYKGLPYTKIEVSVSDDEVNAEIYKDREKNSRIITVEGRAVENGDIVTIDYEGSVDDVTFQGGTAKDYDLTIGSKSFIPGFEEQIIGHNIDEAFDIFVKFPDEYHSEELKGKEAKFAIKLKDIKVKELPEADDEFAQDVSEFDTLNDYKENIKKELLEKKENEAKNSKENELMEKLIEKAEMDLPEVMVDNQVEQLIYDLSQRMKYQGISMEMYLQIMGKTMDSLKESYRENASNQVRGRLVLEEIIKLENIEATEDELNEEIDRIALQYGIDRAHLEGTFTGSETDQLKDDICVRKALKLITESAVEA